MLFKFALPPIEQTFGVSVLRARLTDQLVTSTTILDSFLPLQVELVTLLVQPLELLGSLVKFDLSGLRLCNLLLKLGCFLGNLNRQFFDLKGEFFDFGFVRSSILLQCQVVFFLLAGGQGPLLELLLVPVHFELELVHAFVRLEDHVLNVVQAVLLICDPLLQLLNFVLQSSALSFSDLLEMLFSLDFFVFGVNQALRVHQFHLDRLEVFLQNFESFLVLLNFEA